MPLTRACSSDAEAGLPLSMRQWQSAGRSLMFSGVDARGFDSENKLVFESCCEGVISVIRETMPDYALITSRTRFPRTAKISTSFAVSAPKASCRLRD
jgi:hypothetical protein